MLRMWFAAIVTCWLVAGASAATMTTSSSGSSLGTAHVGVASTTTQTITITNDAAATSALTFTVASNASERADLDQRPKPLCIKESFAAQLKRVEGIEVEDCVHPAVDDHRADLGTDIDDAVGLEDAHGFANGVAARGEHLAELALGRELVADTQITLVDQ